MPVSLALSTPLHLNSVIFVSQLTLSWKHWSINIIKSTDLGICQLGISSWLCQILWHVAYLSHHILVYTLGSNRSPLVIFISLSSTGLQINWSQNPELFLDQSNENLCGLESLGIWILHPYVVFVQSDTSRLHPSLSSGELNGTTRWVVPLHVWLPH